MIRASQSRFVPCCRAYRMTAIAPATSSHRKYRLPCFEIPPSRSCHPSNAVWEQARSTPPGCVRTGMLSNHPPRAVLIGDGLAREMKPRYDQHANKVRRRLHGDRVRSIGSLPTPSVAEFFGPFDETLICDRQDVGQFSRCVIRTHNGRTCGFESLKSEVSAYTEVSA
jgi:hypothetical protein